MSHRLGRFASFALLATSATFLACQESPTAPGGTSGVVTLDGASTADASNPVVLSVTGSGQTTAIGTLPGYEGVPGWRTFSVNATRHADDPGNTASGHTQFNNRANGGTSQQARVVCMHQAGSDVIVGAEVTHRVSDLPAMVASGLEPYFQQPVEGIDHGVVFAVRDNGQGAGADPDVITQTVQTTMASVNATCGGALDALLPTLMAVYGLPVEAGNIQVTP